MLKKNGNKQHDKNFEMETDTPGTKGTHEVSKHVQCVEEESNNVKDEEGY